MCLWCNGSIKKTSRSNFLLDIFFNSDNLTKDSIQQHRNQMANRNQKRIAKAIQKEIAHKRQLNPDSRNQNPKRLNSPKDFSKYSHFPGFRKDRKEKVH